MYTRRKPAIFRARIQRDNYARSTPEITIQKEWTWLQLQRKHGIDIDSVICWKKEINSCCHFHFSSWRSMDTMMREHMLLRCSYASVKPGPRRNSSNSDVDRVSYRGSVAYTVHRNFFCPYLGAKWNVASSWSQVGNCLLCSKYIFISAQCYSSSVTNFVDHIELCVQSEGLCKFSGCNC